MQQLKQQILPSHVSGSQVNPTGLSIIQQGDNLLISARELHRLLKAKTKFADWIKSRIDNSLFRDKEDYFSEKSEKLGAGRKAVEYLLTMDMAKHLAMMENNEIGYQIRRRFIQFEKQARGISQLPKEVQVFKGLKRRRINDRVMLDYKEVRERIGSSTRSSTSGERARYWMHFIKEGNRLYCTEEYAVHKYHQKRIINNRQALKAMQPVLPFNFGDMAQLTGGSL